MEGGVGKRVDCLNSMCEGPEARSPVHWKDSEIIAAQRWGECGATEADEDACPSGVLVLSERQGRAMKVFLSGR